MSEPTDPVFVVALLGRTPAVITELLWHLVVQEDARVVGLEVWTTAQPSTQPQSHVVNTAQAIARLRQELPADTIPEPVAPWLVGDPGAWDAEPRVRFVAVERGDRSFLEDLADQADATLVEAAFYDRVRALRRSLPRSVQLVGSLAGGRKTMSTALHTAFGLQADPQDRLVHVFPHPAVEAKLRQVESFGWPTQEMEELSGVAVEDQIVVVDVSFPLLRSRVSAELAESLDTQSYEEFWVRFRQRSQAGPGRATLVRDESQPNAGWRFTVEWPDEHLHVYLTWLNALYIVALVRAPDGLSVEELRSAIPSLRRDFVRTFDDDPIPEADSVRRQLARLRQRLLRSEVPPELLPTALGGGRWHIAACDRVRVGDDE